jgi:hypothetical protein
VPRYDDNSARFIERSKVCYKLESTLSTLFFIETEIHNNNTGTMSSKKRESSINTRRTPNP